MVRARRQGRVSNIFVWVILVTYVVQQCSKPPVGPALLYVAAPLLLVSSRFMLLLTTPVPTCAAGTLLLERASLLQGTLAYSQPPLPLAPSESTRYVLYMYTGPSTMMQPLALLVSRSSALSRSPSALHSTSLFILTVEPLLLFCRLTATTRAT